MWGTSHCFLNNGTQLFTKPSVTGIISHLDMTLDIQEAACGVYTNFILLYIRDFAICVSWHLWEGQWNHPSTNTV